MSGKQLSLPLISELPAAEQRSKAVYDGAALSYEEVHRFENCPRKRDGRLRWDFSALMDEVRTGLGKAGRGPTASASIPGVWILVCWAKRNIAGRPGALPRRPHCRNGGAGVAYNGRPDALWGNGQSDHGHQHTVPAAGRKNAPEVWRRAKRLLFMPDLFIHALCGRRCARGRFLHKPDAGRAPAHGYRDVRPYRIPERLFAVRTRSGIVGGCA